MMTPVLFTFQIILLVIGFGVGYLFLVKAKSQENNLKHIGEIIGWNLIVATIVLEILNFSYSITIVNNSAQKVYLPLNSTSTTEQQQQEQDEGVQPGLQQENGGHPIKQDNNGHGSNAPF